jgi:Zn-dependent protease
MYDEYGTLYIPQGHGRIRFGKTELKHIIIAVLALTLAFAIVMLPGLTGGTVYLRFATAFLVAAAAVVTGFLLHELMHKVVAQRYGAWAEFRLYPLGLVLALLFSVFGFVFAAPGAVYIQGRLTPKQNGLVSLAGPLTNVGVGSVFLVATFLVPGAGLLTYALGVVATINMFLGLFNLLPIPPLDGSKVLAWNIPVYILMLGVTGFLLLISWGFISLW